MAKSRNAKHEVLRIAVAHAEVDKLIEPVVRWLNGFPGVRTEWSCQGDDPPIEPMAVYAIDGLRLGIGAPYVIFYCTNEVSLARILDRLHHLATVEVEFYHGALRYHARFQSASALRKQDPKTGDSLLTMFDRLARARAAAVAVE